MGRQPASDSDGMEQERTPSKKKKSTEKEAKTAQRVNLFAGLVLQRHASGPRSAEQTVLDGHRSKVMVGECH